MERRRDVSAGHRSHHNAGKYEQSYMLHKRALAIREKAFGPDHPEVVPSLWNIANLYRKTGRDKEAEAPRPAIFYGRGRWGACGPRRRKNAV
jgi:hypothetical protein